MSSFIDFKEVKEKVSLEEVAHRLNLPLKPSGDQFRGCCPLCDGDDPRSFVITPSRGLYYSFCCEAGGDQISLYATVKGIPLKQAAKELLDHKAPSVTEETVSDTLSPLLYLEYEHDAVQVLGFESDVAEKLGIGYAKKGMMRGTVAVPVRLPDGTLTGYIGITDAKLPKQFKGI